ncbi:MAG TPA: TIM44-like domain-containing protein [Xanthobacteraceae bacterium]|nr:TIM44-like domain-containing protein [Xanthobacteraceae bacterium]
MARFRFRHLFALLAALAVTGFVISEADARVGRGGSLGSRGARTYSAPPPTATAPSTAAPMQRSITQPNATRPTTPATSPSPGLAGRPGGLFGGGLLGGLAAGFIGAGLFGLLFGHGFLGGLGGFASFLGLLLQIGLVIIVARLAWAWWQRRQQQPALASGPSMRDNPTGNGSGLGSFLGMGAGAGAAAADTGAPLEIEPKDFDAFEQLLGEVQQAYSEEDLNALRRLATPEMLSYFADDLADNASRGVHNKVSDVKLLQGDLAEAWREDDTDYATVAMRFGIVDQMLDRTTGQLVEGSTSPMEATELWTFRRARGGSWVLAGIQQG